MTARELRGAGRRYLYHLSIAWPGIMIVVGGAAVLCAAPKGSALDRLTEPPSFPSQLLAAVILGFVVNRRSRSRLACWVWIPALLLLAWDIHGELGSQNQIWNGTTPWRDVWNMYFSASPDGAGNEVIMTGPLYTSVLYSVAAWAALHWPRRTVASNHSAPRTNAETTN